MPSLIDVLGGMVIAVPALLLCGLGVWSLTGRRLSETVMTRLVSTSITAGLIAAFGVLTLMLISGERHVVVPLGDRVELPDYHFSLRFVFDRLSMPFVILSYVLCGTIGSFAGRYMHREPGYNRFFVLYALFLAGMVTTSLAGTIETLFAGWEMVGLSSALLVAFFHERPAPVRNGLWIWTIYRFADAALLMAALMLHRMAGHGDFEILMNAARWPLGNASSVESQQVLVVGLLLLTAAAGKSALVPFSGWLPRAMEGPTPSSAVFYGSLSVHLGAFLLLRVSPMLERSAVLCGGVIVLGLLTTALATAVERVQTDIKSALSFASMMQVGVIFAEIGLIGLLRPWLGAWAWYLPLVHILGHACLRTLQFVRAPSLLQDYRILENAIGGRLPRQKSLWRNVVSRPVRLWLYRFALERGYLDAWLVDVIAEPFLALFRWFDGFERRWIHWLSGEPTPPHATAAPIAIIEELK